MYTLAKPLLFRLDPERAHRLIMSGLAWSARHPGALQLISLACSLPDPRLVTERFGLTFANPIGLAAGFDKSAEAVPTWPALGFGFSEVGSVTAHAQEGNPKPRLFRLPQDDALINRLGFNNDGAATVAQRLSVWRRRELGTPVGINIGKSRVAPLDRFVDDYRQSLTQLWHLGDYLVLNVSSPNTPGLLALQAEEPLTELLELVSELGASLGPRPVLLKIAPDLEFDRAGSLAELAAKYRLAGLIATNTTTTRDGLRGDPGQEGGLSGAPLRQRSLAMLKLLRSASDLPVISVGGVATVEDVAARLRAGACLVQLYTAYIYQGPRLLHRLCRGLIELLDGDGLASIEELIGQDYA